MITMTTKITDSNPLNSLQWVGRENNLNFMNKEKTISLIRQAHDHAFAIASSNLKWTEEESWVEFLKRNNLRSVDLFSFAEKKKVVCYLLSENRTIRDIAKILGYKHPGSVTYIINKRVGREK